MWWCGCGAAGGGWCGRGTGYGWCGCGLVRLVRLVRLVQMQHVVSE